MKRALFVLRDLPRATVSIESLFAGREALSGTHLCTLLVAEGLARRGWEIGLLSVRGGSLTQTAIEGFSTVAEAASWAANAHVVWSYYGDDPILDQLNQAGLRPILWSHIHVPGIVREWLRDRKVAGLLTVSDTARLTQLRSRAHRRVGRVYNCLAPVFAEPVTASAQRYTQGAIVFAGYLNVSKGAHRLLQMWQRVRRLEPGAKLLLAGSEKLYGSDRAVGPSGLAAPAFEEQYLAPIIAEFGSLENAGIYPAGLLQPVALRDLYQQCRLGIVNPNWHEYTETFCCSAAEMLATELPVFSVARGALPETIGRTGGAWLTGHEDLQQAASELATLIRDPDRLRQLGRTGAQFVRQHYGLGHIVDAWERVFGDPSRLDLHAGPWRGPTNVRYRMERWAGKLNLEPLVTSAAKIAHALKGG